MNPLLKNFNLASGKETSIIKMAKLVKKVTNNDLDFYTNQGENGTQSLGFWHPRKANKLIGYSPFLILKMVFCLPLNGLTYSKMKFLNQLIFLLE